MKIYANKNWRIILLAYFLLAYFFVLAYVAVLPVERDDRYSSSDENVVIQLSGMLKLMFVARTLDVSVLIEMQLVKDGSVVTLLEIYP